jgi:1,4-dihydroxy-2-naphthoyl-CoA hydrolase
VVGTRGTEPTASRQRSTSSRVAVQSNRAITSTDFWPDLAKITVATCVLCGDTYATAPIDPTGPPAAAQRPDAVLKVHEGASHGLFKTLKDQLNADLLAFINGQQHRRPGAPRGRSSTMPGRHRISEDFMDDLERLRQSPLPFAALLGIHFTSATAERVTAELVVRDDLCTRPAILHGGAMMAFADTLGAAATMLNLADSAGTTTIESKTNFLATAPAGTKILGETTPVHRGRRTMVWQTRVMTEAGRMVALVTQTQLVIEPRAS